MSQEQANNALDMENEKSDQERRKLLAAWETLPLSRKELVVAFAECCSELERFYVEEEKRNRESKGYL